MKKSRLILLLIMAIVSGKSISQTDTKNKVVIDVEIAKKIANDLVAGDVCKAKLKITENNISLLEKKVSLKDSVIANLEKQNYNLGLVISYKDDAMIKQEEVSKTYKAQLRKSKTTTFIYKIISYVGIGAFGYVLIR